MVEKVDMEAAVDAGSGEGPSREALLKGYDAEEADALLALEQKLDGRGDDETAVDPEAMSDAITAATIYRNGS